jgi:predicted transglutaminase-like cysteine proteinase
MTKGLFPRLTLAATLALSAAPALAQALPFGAAVAKPYSSEKTEAILGGESKLAQILAQQGAQPARSTFAAASAAPAPAGPGYVVRPAAMPIFAPPAADRPDVFGSVALSIGKTPLDRRWNAVARGSAGRAASAYAASVSTFDALARIDAVNRYVNERVAYVNDIRLSGVEDRWTVGNETLARGKGDCEDFAIAKMQMLRRAGVAEKDLYLVVLRDLRRNADHAVLVVRAENRLLVLDNGTDRIVDSAMMTDYRPIFTFSGSRSWTHGYRQVPPTITYASLERPTIEAPATTTLAAMTTAPAPALVPAPSAND